MPRMNIRQARPDLDRKKTFKRLIGYLFHTYPVHFVVISICIIIVAVGSIAGSIFIPMYINDVIMPGIQNGSFESVKPTLIGLSIALGSVYLVSFIASSLYNHDSRVLISFKNGYVL